MPVVTCMYRKQDLADVYQSKLKFLPKKLDSKKVSFRVTNNVM